ncbi:MAG TPA: CinA family protein [Magnetospirillum sp.]|nr:CinA family protein [Magnetospirillum sp.]
MNACRDGAIQVLEVCKAGGLMVATAESCTGGLVAAALTAIPGSSSVVDRGFVTYSNAAKAQMLGVPMALIDTHGAVSEQVARAMAEGALDHSQAHVAVAVTGVAGPDGGSADKPVGLVHFAAARRDGAVIARHRIFAGDRDAVREQSVVFALALLEQAAR